MIHSLPARLALVLIAGVILSSGGCSADAPPNGRASLEAGFGPMRLPLEVHATVARSHYLPGEEVDFQLSFKNSTTAPVTIHSFPPPVDIVEPLEWGVAYHFPGGSRELTLAPGEVTEQAFAWAQVDADGAPVSPGHYALYLNDIHVGEGVMGWRSEPTSSKEAIIFIAHPGGELLRTLAPGISQDIGGVRITLDSVEFSATATVVRVHAVPPGYDFPEGRDDGPVMPPMSVLPFQPEASYQVDDGPQRPGGGGGFQPRQHDIQITWTLDPVPASAHLFRFVVTSLKKFDGHWVFTVDLTGQP